MLYVVLTMPTLNKAYLLFIYLFDWMRLDSALKKSRPRYISAQKISTLFDPLDEREIAR
jgi:hypothetical protein